MSAEKAVMESSMHSTDSGYQNNWDQILLVHKIEVNLLRRFLRPYDSNFLPPMNQMDIWQGNSHLSKLRSFIIVLSKQGIYFLKTAFSHYFFHSFKLM